MNEILRSRQLPDIESNGFKEFNFWLNNEYRLSVATANVYVNWRVFVAVEEKRIAVFLKYFRHHPSLPDGCGLPQQRSAAGTTRPGGVHRRMGWPTHSSGSRSVRSGCPAGTAAAVTPRGHAQVEAGGGASERPGRSRGTRLICERLRSSPRLRSPDSPVPARAANLHVAITLRERTPARPTCR